LGSAPSHSWAGAKRRPSISLHVTLVELDRHDAQQAGPVRLVSQTIFEGALGVGLGIADI
jgi:hypothetical protein